MVLLPSPNPLTIQSANNFSSHVLKTFRTEGFLFYRTGTVQRLTHSRLLRFGTTKGGALNYDFGNLFHGWMYGAKKRSFCLNGFDEKVILPKALLTLSNTPAKD
jgi:hypothetical protein